MKTLHIVLGTLGAMAVVMGLWIARPGPFTRLDLRAYDHFLRRSAQPPATGRVSIVAVDEQSIAEFGQWPWRRDVMGRLVERLHDLGAHVVAFDMILSEPDRHGGPAPGDLGTATDAALAAALRSHRAVTGFAFTFNTPGASASGCALRPLQAVQVAAAGVPSPENRLFEPSGVICSLPMFNQAAGASGFLNVSRDVDGIVRRVPLVMDYMGEIYPSLGLAAVQQSSGTRTVTLHATTGQELTLGLAGQTIPTDARGRLLLRFRGSRGAFGHVPASDVLAGRLPAGSFANRIVFVGATALGLSDYVPTPLDTSYLGVEVHATVAESLLARQFISLPSYAGLYELGGGIVGGLLVATLTIAGGLLWGALGTVIGCIFLWMLTSWSFDLRHTFFSPVLPMASATTSLVVLTVVKVVHERRRAETEKRRRQQAHRFIVQSLTLLTGTRDVNTGRHARRTQGYTRIVATQLARLPRFRRTLSGETIELMAILAPLHDIGKVGIPDALLNKPGPLTQDEHAQMQTHPRLGYDTIVNAEALSLIDDEEIIRLAKEMVFTHHEWFNGQGYPRGLAGEEIPIGGRVLAVVDVYDALVAPRPYRVQMPHEQAVMTIRAQRGTHFDPDVVDAFVAVERDIKALTLALNA